MKDVAMVIIITLITLVSVVILGTATVTMAIKVIERSE